MSEVDARPLPERMRPRRLEDLVGQNHLLGPGAPIAAAARAGRAYSAVLWGPPGVGKTTLARLWAEAAGLPFRPLSAVTAGVKDLRTVCQQAQALPSGHSGPMYSGARYSGPGHSGPGALVFVDEIHAFNKTQQDVLLPEVEAGVIVLLGATTENPSFALNSALLSRVKVHVLKALDAATLSALLDSAMREVERGLGGQGLLLAPAAAELMATSADGDARRALLTLELAAELARAEGGGEITESHAAQAAGQGLRRFDRGGEQHYDLISALHKSMRGSDPDAALYYLARMLDGGADRHFIARRLVRTASEDVGLADPRALTLALDAWTAYDRLGSPEGELALMQAAVYLAVAPKSNALYRAQKTVLQAVAETGSAEVPLPLRNAPTRLMRQLGYAEGYRYAHDEPGAFAAGEAYLPEALRGRRFYQPTPRGLEREIGARLKRLAELNAEARRVVPGGQGTEGKDN